MPLIHFTISRSVNGQPHHLNIPAEHTRMLEVFYLNLLLTPRPSREIEPALVEAGLVDPKFATALKLTLQTRLFLRKGRFVDSTWQKGFGFTYFTTPAGADYLASLKLAEGAAK